MSNELQLSPNGPINESVRIQGIDVARGFALFGIFFVNVAFFSMPFGEMYTVADPVAEGWMSRLVYWFTGIFCEGKFYPLFSLLFGAGLAILYQSSIKSGRNFGWIYFRRLVVLAGFGIVHIVFLWYGDILLLYSCVGLTMLLLVRASPKVLLVVAAIAFCISMITALGVASLSLIEDSDPISDSMDSGSEVAPEVPADDNSFEKIVNVFFDWNSTEEFESRIARMELEVNSEGPLSAAILLRLFLYAFSLIYYVLVTTWVVLTCFCIGAALAKIGFFNDSNSVWRRRFMVLGVTVGLPISIVVNYCNLYSDNFVFMLIYMVGVNVSGVILALAYLSSILALVERYPRHRLAIALSQLGRMGLTGYLMESLLISALMSHWGLAWFGTTTWAQRAGIVVVIYLCILGFANIWMHRFRYGPMEWLWRSLTYLKWQPILR